MILKGANMIKSPNNEIVVLSKCGAFMQVVLGNDL